MANRKSRRIPPSVYRSVKWLVDKYVHAGCSNLRAIRIVLHGDSWIGAPARWPAFRQLSRAQRRQTIGAIIRAHQENRQLYRAVMSGRF